MYEYFLGAKFVPLMIMKQFQLLIAFALLVPYMLKAGDNEQVTNPFAIYKFQHKNNFVGISPLPGRVDLEADLITITTNKITNVVSLVSNEELEHYKVPTLIARLKEKKVDVLHSPIVDYGVPSREQVVEIIEWVKMKIKSKENVLIHCVGGLGRSGTIMAVYAKVYLGKTGEEAIQFVRSIRGNEAVETEGQQNFVINW